MAIVNYFYHGLIKRYVALFGISFNKLVIKRSGASGYEQDMIVPISYGPYQKFLSRLTQDPNLDRKTAISLPRMAFEITSIEFDGERKLAKSKKILTTDGTAIDQSGFIYSPIPFNIEFSLYIMAKNAEDGAQLVEQILPIMAPEWTYSVELLDNVPPFDIPIIYRGINMEDLYESNFEQRRSLVWTLNFTMKAYLIGPQRTKKIIKFIDIQLATDTLANTVMEDQILVYPGLTAGGLPTTDPTLTIPYANIDEDDNWGVIQIIQDEITT